MPTSTSPRGRRTDNTLVPQLALGLPEGIAFKDPPEAGGDGGAAAAATSARSSCLQPADGSGLISPRLLASALSVHQLHAQCGAAAGPRGFAAKHTHVMASYAVRPARTAVQQPAIAAVLAQP